MKTDVNTTRGRWKQLAELFLLLLCSMLASCSGGSSPVGGPETGDAFGLPFPQPDWQDPRSVSAADVTVHSGADYALTLANNNASALNRGSVELSADYLPGLPLSRVACSTYNFKLSSYNGPGELALSWADAPSAGNLWIGLSNYKKKAWEWVPCPGSSVHFDLASGDYQDSKGQMQVVVLIAAQDLAELFAISVGPDAYPVALCKLEQTYANPGDVVTIDASPSFDPGGQIVKYEFDPENNGSFVDKGSVKTISHVYNQPGTVAAHIRVTDSTGHVSEGYKFIHISWQHSFLELGLSAEATAVAMLPQGSVCFGGSLDNGNNGQRDAMLVCLDQAGNYAWCRSFGLASEDQLTALISDAAGMLYGAVILGSNSPQSQAVIFKCDASGDLKWQKAVNSIHPTDARLLRDSDGNLQVFMVEGSQTPNNMYSMRMDLDGNLIDRGLIYNDCWWQLGGLCEDDHGYMYLSGLVSGPGMQSQSGFVMKYDLGGSYYFGEYADQAVGSRFRGVCFDGSQVLISGEQISAPSTQGLVISIAVDGQLKWARTYSMSGGVGSLSGNPVPLKGGGMLISGTSGNAAGGQAFAMSLDPIGTCQSAWAFGKAADYSSAASLCLDDSGAIYLIGLSTFNETGFSKAQPVEADLGLQLKPISSITFSGTLFGLSDATAYWTQAMPFAIDLGGMVGAQLYPEHESLAG